MGNVKNYSLHFKPTPSKLVLVSGRPAGFFRPGPVSNSLGSGQMTPMHAQSIFIYIYIKIHGSQK